MIDKLSIAMTYPSVILALAENKFSVASLKDTAENVNMVQTNWERKKKEKRIARSAVGQMNVKP